jgi:hypothetical protein
MECIVFFFPQFPTRFSKNDVPLEEEGKVKAREERKAKADDSAMSSSSRSYPFL